MKLKLKSVLLKILIVVFIIVIAFLFIFAKKEKITGEIRIVGTSLFYDLVITTEERDYYFDKKFFDEYSKYEGEIITIEAKVKKSKLWLADRSRYLERYDILWVKKVD